MFVRMPTPTAVVTSGPFLKRKRDAAARSRSRDRDSVTDGGSAVLLHESGGILRYATSPAAWPLDQAH